MLALGGLLLQASHKHCEFAEFLPGRLSAGASVVLIISLGTLINMITGCQCTHSFSIQINIVSAFFLLP